MLPLDLERIQQLFTARVIWGFILIGLINAVLMVAISYRYFQAMQQCGYKGRDYLKWLARKDNVFFNRLLMLSIISVLGFILINMALMVIEHQLVKYAGFVVYFIFLAIYFRGEIKRKDKVPLVLTKRMIRLIISFIVLSVIFSYLLITAVNLIAIPLRENPLAQFRYAILCFCPIIVPYILLVAYYINEPLERKINKKYISKCTLKLKSLDNMVKIGITGSYAKTTVKEILKTMLAEKFKVYATPESYNTPLGIAKAVKHIDGTEDVFIVEMGARRVGDIKELTQIVNPSIAVITGVTTQHLETFNVIDNIKKTKYEIIENMQSGKAVFSCDNAVTLEMFKECELEKRLAGLDAKTKPYVYASDIKCDKNGSSFTLHIGKKTANCVTKLIGKHNVSNVCIGAAVADYMGVDISFIASAISKIKVVKHRFELIETKNGVTVIDDSYNSNPVGAIKALESLEYFSGRKFLVTPGIVELGVLENEINFNFGKKASEVTDVVVLIGRARTLKIREGLLLSGFSEENIIMAKTLSEARDYIAKNATAGDVVLFENDLPDKYN